jgi:hypothetical protein
VKFEIFFAKNRCEGKSKASRKIKAKFKSKYVNIKSQTTMRILVSKKHNALQLKLQNN